MTKVDCEDCYEKFNTKKLYITHVKSKTCTKAKTKKASKARMVPGQEQQEAKRARTEAAAAGGGGGDPLALVSGGEGQFASPARLEELQGQIKNLTEDQKRALQEQITKKQRQVLQAIPYNQLSAKQKEILKKLSGGKSPLPPPSSSPTVQSRTITPPTRTTTPPSRTATPPIRTTTPPAAATKYITLKAGQVVSQAVKAPQVKKTNIQIVRRPAQKKAPELPVIEIGEDTVFSTESIAAEEQPGDPWQEDLEEEGGVAGDVTADRAKVGGIRIKSFAKSMLKFANVLERVAVAPSSLATTPVRPTTPTGKPQATVKENCVKCKKIFSKSSIEAHMEAKHKIDCAKCQLKFLPEQLEDHMRTEHEMPKEACTVCGKVVYKQVLAQHIDIFHKAECKVCKTKYIITELQEHVRNEHEKEVCDECPARFETRDDVAVHINSTHMIEKCEECDNRFQSVEFLDRHMEKVHPKEYCEENSCDSVFGTKEQLAAHKEKKHPNPNKFLTFGGGMFMMMMVPDSQKEDVANDDYEDAEMEDSADVLNLSKDIILDLVEEAMVNVSKMCSEIVRDICDNLPMRKMWMVVDDSEAGEEEIEEDIVRGEEVDMMDEH